VKATKTGVVDVQSRLHIPRDELRIREKQLRENLAWLNRFLLSLLRQHPIKDSIVIRRRGCGWDENFLLQVLTGVAL
jgi:hypothetical protein